MKALNIKQFIHNLKTCHEFKPYKISDTQKQMDTNDGFIALNGICYQKEYTLPGLQDTVVIDCGITQSTTDANRIGVIFWTQLHTEAGTTDLETFFNFRLGTNSNLSKISIVKIVKQFLAIARGCSLYVGC